MLTKRLVDPTDSRKLFTHFSLVLLACVLCAASGRAQGPEGGPRLNERFPLKNESELSPPIVASPIHECAKVVHVSGFLPHALVRVFANGTELVGTARPLFGFADILLTRALVLGDRITATQTVLSITSVQSYDPVVVDAFPTTLNKPAVGPDLYACGRVVPVGDLVPSVHVSVFKGGSTDIGEADAPQSWQPVVTSSLAAGDSITAVQTACPDIPSKKISSPPSDPVLVKSDPAPIPTPLVDPYVAGSDAITMHSLLVGALVQVFDRGTLVGSGLATAADNWTSVNPPLSSASAITVTQSLCTSSAPSSSQGPSSSLRAPLIVAPVCEGTHYVTIRNTVLNSIVVLFRNGQIVGMAGGVMGDLVMALGGGASWTFGDQVSAVQYVGSVISPRASTVIVDCSGGGNVVTQHNNNYRTGLNQNETTLTPAAVFARGMRVKYSKFVDGAIGAQPLYVRGALEEGRTAGLFVATFNNWVYGLRASDGFTVWHTRLVDSDTNARPLTRAISSTPVIDLATHRMYVLFSTMNQAQNTANCPDSTQSASCCCTYEDQLSALDVAYWVVALDYRTGVELQRTRVAASLTRSDGTPVDFVAKNQFDRTALLLDHGSLYIAFCMRFREEIIEYHGWVMRYRASDLQFQAAFNTSPDSTVPTSPFTSHEAEGAGIWNGGGGLSADPQGNVFFLVGNAHSDPPSQKFGDTFLKLTPSASSLTPTAFVPSGAATLEANDADLGAGGTMVIPNSKFVIGGGKTGYLYLLTRSSMNLQQQLTAATNQYNPSLRDQAWDVGPHLHGSPNYWRGPNPKLGYLYVWGEKDFLRQYSFNHVTGSINPTPLHVGTVEALNQIMPGGMISISSFGNAAGSGVVWATLPASSSVAPGANAYPGHLYALNAETLQPLWDTGFDSLGKWLEPTIADGTVYVGTSSNKLIAYELGPQRCPTCIRHIPYRPRNLMMNPRPMHELYPDGESERIMPALALQQLAPEDGLQAILALRGEGEQIYESVESPGESGKYSWRPKESVATLWRVDPDAPDSDSRTAKILVRLSPQSVWTAHDGSRISGKPVRTVPSPDPTAMGWTLFAVSAKEQEKEKGRKEERGEGLLDRVNFVQEVFTEGGLPPKQQPARAGQLARAHFRANYVFFGKEAPMPQP